LLRALLYFEQRVQWHAEESGGPSEPPARRFAFARALISAIRAAAGPSTTTETLPVFMQGVARATIAARLRELVGDVLDKDARVPELEQALVMGIETDALAASVEDLRAGSGGELAAVAGKRPKLHSAYSSAALVVSTFARWRLQPKTLAIAGRRGFESLAFEVRCPIFASAKATPPNLDVVLKAPGQLLAIESKLTEHLAGTQRAEFSAAYPSVVPGLLDRHWQQLHARLQANPTAFEFVNAAQLVKHALGLRKCFPAHEITLLYLYWEPTNAVEHSTFAAHAAEVAELRAKLADSELSFEPLTYASLWGQWDAQPADQALRDHVRLLRARYDLVLPVIEQRRRSQDVTDGTKSV
jgi:hypothetical protein